MRRAAVLLASLALLAIAAVRLLRRRSSAERRLPPPRRPALQHVAALPAGTRFVSVPWTLVAAPREDAQLTLRYACGDQLELDRVDAQETPTQVFVTVLLRRHPPAGGALARRRERERETTVALSGPLGSRTLVHAPVDLDADPGALPGGEPSASPLYP